MSAFIPCRSEKNFYIVIGDSIGDTDRLRDDIFDESRALYKGNAISVMRALDLNGESININIFESLLGGSVNDKIKNIEEFVKIEYVIGCLKATPGYLPLQIKTEDGSGKFLNLYYYNSFETALNYIRANYLKEGNIVTYHSNGNVKEIKKMKNKKLEGRYRSFNKDGEKLKDCIYCDGKLHGICSEYNKSSIITSKYNRGKQEGILIQRTDDGYEEHNFEKDKRHGNSYIFTKSLNGTLTSDTDSNLSTKEWIKEKWVNDTKVEETLLRNAEEIKFSDKIDFDELLKTSKIISRKLYEKDKVKTLSYE